MDTSKKLPTVLSLCSGYGGLERGLELAGFEHRTVAYVEIEAYAIANLANKMERGQLLPAPIWSNLKTLPVEPFRGRVDILTGGYPCQPFSAAGKRQGKDDSEGRHLWPYILRIIKSVRPVRCFFENVEGHISLGLREVIADLEGLGYATAWGIFSAAEVGAPHQRKRVFIMADTDNRQCELAEQEIRAGGIAVTNGSAELGNAANIRRRGWAKNSEREGSANIQEQSKPNFRGEFERSSQAVADTLRSRSETRISGSQQPNQKGYAGITDNRCGQSRRWEIGMQWPAEPRILRVVDGCADRVDRIRLLGNGICPPTAAKAWRVLDGESLRNY